MKKKLFGIFTLVVGLSIIGFTGFALGTKDKMQEVVASSTYKYDIYVDIQSCTNYTEGVYCHNWGTSGTSWPGTKMTLIKDTLYGVNLKSSSNANCIFNSGNGGKQTGDLEVKKGQVYVMDSDTNGEWQTLDEIVTNSNSSSDTMRIFVNNSDLSNWSSAGAETHLRVWGTSVYETGSAVFRLNGNWFENGGEGASGVWYAYADVPTDIEGFQFVRCPSANNRRIWGYTSAITEINAESIARIYKIKESNWDFTFEDRTYDESVGPTLLSKVLEAYDTCSSSELNGAGAVNSIKSNFYDRATTNAKNTIIKSLNGDESGSYTAKQHIEGMELFISSTSNAAGALNFVNDNYIYLLVVIAIVGVSIAGFVVLKKKRQTN